MSRRPEYDETEELGRRPRRKVDASQVILTALLALFLGGCLGSGSLVGLAERQEVGTTRDVVLGIAKANDRVANFFSLNRPSDAIDAAIGRTDDEVDVDDLLAERGIGGTADETTGNGEASGAGATTTPDAATPTTADGLDAADDGGAADGQAGPDEQAGDATPAPTAAPPTEAAPPFRTPTVDDPLRMWVGGDSMSREVGYGMQEATVGQPVAVELGFEISSGLSRPDFFDWPQQLAQLVTREQPPDAIVVMFGANDWQDFEHEGAIYRKGTPEWLAVYRERVARSMDILDQPGLHVVWVGQPIMSEPILDGGMQAMNAVYADEASRRPWVEYLDTRAVFADPNGLYSSTLDGVLMRDGDGVHLAGGGPARMGNFLWSEIRDDWGL